MEKASFRDIIAMLNARFPDRDMLTVKDCATVIGCSERTVARKIKLNALTHRVSKPDFARQISA